MIPLIILGLLKQNPGAHGYELLSLMAERHYQYIVSYTKGSFYYHLQQLEEKGFIHQIAVLQTEQQREAQHYEITEQGELEFERLMVAYGEKTDYVKLSFYNAMLFVHEYDTEKFKQLLQQQISETEKRIERLTQSITGEQILPDYFVKMLENSRSHHQVNLAWFKSLLEEQK